MSEAKHTPGEWQAKGWRVCSIDEGGNCHHICDTGSNKASRTGRKAADAVLIAAAPDMLTALEKILEGGTAKDWQDGQDMAKAAIAKAKGV